MLGKHDADVQDWIKRVRINGGVINNRIVMAGAEAIMTKLAKHKLEKYGGHVTITKTYARSILRHMGFVKRKGTKSVKVLPSDFDEIKRKYIERVGKCTNENRVPDDLILNWDQTGCQLVQGGEWTMETRAPRGTDRSPEYNEHICYKLDSRVKNLTTEWNQKQQHFITHASRSLL